MKSANITSVFNIPEIEEDEPDYKRLYEKEKKMRVFYERKTKELENRLRNCINGNILPIIKPREHKIHHAMQDIKSFKSLLPNSVKVIPAFESDSSISGSQVPTLIKQWAIYGLTEDEITNASENTKINSGTLASNQNPSQILQHSARLVFPSGTTVRKVNGKAAAQCSLDIINLSKEKMKSFILTFEPAQIEKKSVKEAQEVDPNMEIINQLNPQRKIFAICIELDEYTISGEENQMIELKTHRSKPNLKTNKSVKFVDPSSGPDNTFSIVVSKRVYAIFSYYPFFAFFEELLKSLLYAVKVDRYIRYKEGGQNLKLVDSKSHSKLMKNALQELRIQASTKPIVIDKLLDFSVCGNNKAYLQLNKEALAFCMAEEWAYYVLSLFTLDVFLDLLTLMILQEKIVFVCPNATILTHAIYLFTKVLIKPFEYPYPVVNLIPDQEEYLNAPFPVVYGYLKTRKELEDANIPKRYKNVYVYFDAFGVEIQSTEDKKKVLSKKSPRLRDRLISKFKKMHRNFPSMPFFSLRSKKNMDFEYPVNVDLAREIISEVFNYVDRDIFRLLPDEASVEAIKQQLFSEKNIDEEDINREVYLRIKEEYSPRSRDPFFAAFLDTQIFNVYIFKY